MRSATLFVFAPLHCRSFKQKVMYLSTSLDLRFSLGLKNLKFFIWNKLMTKDDLNLRGEEGEVLTETLILNHLTSEYNFTRLLS